MKGEYTTKNGKSVTSSSKAGSIFFWSKISMPFKELGKVGYFIKALFVGNLFQTVVGAKYGPFNFKDHVFVDEVLGRIQCETFDNLVQVFGRNGHGFRIVFHIASVPVIFFYQIFKLKK